MGLVGGAVQLVEQDCFKTRCLVFGPSTDGASHMHCTSPPLLLLDTGNDW